MTTMESKLSRRNNLLYANCTDLLSTDWWVLCCDPQLYQTGEFESKGQPTSQSSDMFL